FRAVAADVRGGAPVPREVHLLSSRVRARRAQRLAARPRQDAGGEEDALERGRAGADPCVSARDRGCRSTVMRTGERPLERLPFLPVNYMRLRPERYGGEGFAERVQPVRGRPSLSPDAEGVVGRGPAGGTAR